MFENLGTEAKLLRIISALTRHAGGELRVPCELVDAPGEPTTLVFTRDRATQDFVIHGAKATEVVLDVLRINPEKSPKVSVAPTVQPEQPAPPANGYTRSSPGLTDEQLIELEKKLTKRRVATLMAEDLKRRLHEQQQ